MFRERKAGGKVMRENEPVLLVLSVCDGEIILENGEILCEKRHVESVATVWGVTAVPPS
jgi:hypothetical protein